MFFRSKFSSNLCCTGQFFLKIRPGFLFLFFRYLAGVSFVCFFCANFERKVSLSWRYFCISRVISLNSVSETRLISRACDTELFIESCFETARAWILECLLTLRSSFLLITDRPVEAPPDKAATRQQARRLQFRHQ